MNHQPFENWILEKPELTKKDEHSLKEHLLTCNQCQKLHTSWQEVETHLTHASEAKPAPGFGKRFKISLAERRERQHQAQVRRFILMSTAASLVALFILIGRLLSKNSITEIAVNLFNIIYGAVSQIGNFITSLINSLNGPSPILLWIIASTILALLCLGWGYSIWKYVIQGAQHENL